MPGEWKSTVFTTQLGWIGLAWSSDGALRATAFAHATVDEALASLIRTLGRAPDALIMDPSGAKELSDTQRLLATRLAAFAAGAADSFLDVELPRVGYTEFQWRVVEHCRAIPYGATLSYGQLAARAGAPRAARAVGNVMRSNRYPPIVPCHRVLASQGRLGGYSAPRGLILKKQLLVMERRGDASAAAPAAAPAAVT